MARRIFPCFLVLLMASATGMARERVEERTFSATGVAELAIKAYGGNLVIVESLDGMIHVKLTAASALSDEQAAAKAQQSLVLDSRREGDRVTLEISNPRETSVHFDWDDGVHLEVAATVAVPRSCRLNLETGVGEIRVGEIKGGVRVQARQGAIFCRYVDGPVWAHTGRGDIVVSHCTGDVDLRTDRGGIRTGRIEGRATLAARSGDIEIMSAGRGLAVSADGGDVIAGIPPQFSGDGFLSAAGGSITLKIDPAARLDLDASSIWGRVRSLTTRPLGFPLITTSGGLGQSSLVGKINLGGARLRARANGGHINLAAEAAPFS